ncbi:hypothetical protein [Clostridium amazonitimonense]|uniref:hypothetical protein n=1 Tax=Clostridium amazonitimonense TaxID=1499689 RepID=UPI000509D8E7|nr:hypothetical protein [Clostridium amazonitimonense]
MKDLLNKLLPILPMLLTLTLSQIIYLKMDKRYGLTNKISAKLPVKQDQKELFCICCFMISMLIIGVFGIYVIHIPSTIYFGLSGILLGIGISVTHKISLIKIN